ncbi:MAG TPA: anaerobic ribonucleoside-triphosphate reductase activating protein [Lentisphaeria bacterium]|nr:anaerobic ribonucleoside-triphosphate reductase activating protein [Lentisphaeria bacterium]
MSSFSAIHAFQQHASLVDYPGRLSALMFTQGCNFRCGFCHNVTLLAGGGKNYTWGELEDICQRFKRQWVKGVVISGGEPTIQASLPETIDFFRRHGFAIKLDTNGSLPAVLEAIIDRVDYVAMDIKCALDSYKSLTGFGDYEKIRQSVRLVMERARDYEFRTTVIETFHTEQELHDCGKLAIGAKRYIVQPFVPHDDLLDVALRQQPRTRPSRMQEAAAILRAYVQEVLVRGA